MNKAVWSPLGQKGELVAHPGGEDSGEVLHGRHSESEGTLSLSDIPPCVFFALL